VPRKVVAVVLLRRIGIAGHVGGLGNNGCVGAKVWVGLENNVTGIAEVVGVA
jgi:hypothetical protein